MRLTLALLLILCPVLALADLPEDPLQLPSGSQVLRDRRYGNDPLQRYDVYLPPSPRQAPILLMVHGGGWYTGDKALDPVVDNKAAHWLAEGYVLVSVNYRLVPKVDVRAQAQDLAQAIREVQRQAPEWQADPNKLVLMGHSSGGHLVALLSSDPRLSNGISPHWRGSVILDSAAYDIATVMAGEHWPLYDRAFGDDRVLWHDTSPLQVLQAGAAPMLLVCSTLREGSCPQAKAYASKAQGLGNDAQVLEQRLSHRQINERLGRDPAYTAKVETFLGQLGLP